MVQKILHTDLKISLDETDRDKLERLGCGEVPQPFRQLEGTSGRGGGGGGSGAALRSLRCGGASSPAARPTPNAGLL